MAKTSLRGPHIHSTAGRGGRVGHDNKGLNEIDSQCVGRENSFQKVRYLTTSIYLLCREIVPSLRGRRQESAEETHASCSLPIDVVDNHRLHLGQTVSTLLRGCCSTTGYRKATERNAKKSVCPAYNGSVCPAYEDEFRPTLMFDPPRRDQAPGRWRSCTKKSINQYMKE